MDAQQQISLNLAGLEFNSKDDKLCRISTQRLLSSWSITARHLDSSKLTQSMLRS